MKYYLEKLDTVLKCVNGTTQGLSHSEAQKRLAEKGKNKLVVAKKISIIKRFFLQLADPMIIILIVAALISGITAIYANESFADVFIILFVVIINSVLGVYQESKAEKAIEALQEMAAATSKVIRDNNIIHIKSEDLVVGDVVLLEAGDAVPADGRLFECVSMKVEEAALTGESVPVSKVIMPLVMETLAHDVSLGDRKNMVYMGSTVVYGHGKAIIVGTGMETEMGKIANALTLAEDNQTPLQLKLNQLSKILTILVVAVCAFIFAFTLITTKDFSTSSILNTFMIAVSLAVAAIPEGLAAVVTILLSIGVTNMSKRNAVIRKLTAVETLGCTQIICSDKTGTLTQNMMSVVDYVSCDQMLLAQGMALCSDAEINEDGMVIGEPTECALVKYAQTLELSKTKLKKEHPRVGEAPFDSMRKMMTTIHRDNENTYIQYTKGAPDEILKRCTHYLDEGGIVTLTPEYTQKIMHHNKQMADKALRVLALAVKIRKEMPMSQEADILEDELAFVGLVGMIDPIREEALLAIKHCKEAGIRPIMITGDHKDTAIAIATQLGIIKDPSEAITGAMLDEISDEALVEKISQYSVYARVQPEHKVRIVKAWQSKGKVTAMTGDGVNDAPSIKCADIGVGMGITGTDVTKNVADMVLADDNFATIVIAVEEGRRIYDNMRKAIQFLLASNLSEVVSVFTATVLGFIILKPVHILWINLITDCFPALALGMEKGEDDLMRRKPRDKGEGIFSGGVGFDIMYQGILIMILTVTAYFLGHYIEAGVFEIKNSADGMTMAFLTMSMAEIFHSLNMRSQRQSIFKMKRQNLFLFGAMLISLLLTTAVIYIPVLATAFSFEHISLLEYFVALGLAFLMIPIVEIVKCIERSGMKEQKKN